MGFFPHWLPFNHNPFVLSEINVARTPGICSVSTCKPHKDAFQGKRHNMMRLKEEERMKGPCTPGILYLLSFQQPPPALQPLSRRVCVCMLGGLLCAEGGEAFTPYWMVIIPDRCDGCSSYLALCLNCLQFFFLKRQHPTPRRRGKKNPKMAI